MSRKSKPKRSKASMFLMLALLFAAGISFIVFSKYLTPQQDFSSKESPPPQTVGSDAKVECWFFDVGQGDSELIRIPNDGEYFNVLIDSGDAKYRDGIVKYLKDMGISKLNVLINSHPHADHMGSMAKIVEEFEIGTMYMPNLPDDQVPTTAAYEKLLDVLIEKEVRVEALNTDTNIELPNARLEIFSPKPNEVYSNLNNYSGIMKFTYGKNTILFTGDAEKKVEREVLDTNVDLRADILNCGHHGSNTSTIQEFLDAVNPKYAVISCGLNNDYGHPHEEVMERLVKQGCEIYRTDKDNTVLAELDGENITITKGHPFVDSNK